MGNDIKDEKAANGFSVYLEKKIAALETEYLRYSEPTRTIISGIKTVFFWGNFVLSTAMIGIASLHKASNAVIQQMAFLLTGASPQQEIEGMVSTPSEAFDSPINFTQIEQLFQVLKDTIFSPLPENIGMLTLHLLAIRPLQTVTALLLVTGSIILEFSKPVIAGLSIIVDNATICFTYVSHFLLNIPLYGLDAYQYLTEGRIEDENYEIDEINAAMAAFANLIKPENLPYTPSPSFNAHAAEEPNHYGPIFSEAKPSQDNEEMPSLHNRIR